MREALRSLLRAGEIHWLTSTKRPYGIRAIARLRERGLVVLYRRDNDWWYKPTPKAYQKFSLKQLNCKGGR